MSRSGDSRGLLRRLLSERGLTQAEFAPAAGLSKDHVSRILRGAVPFPQGRRTLLGMARALGCSPDVFIEYREGLSETSPSARHVLARLAERQVDGETFTASVPQYSPGYLRAILAGRSPFPTDPDALKAIAAACGASPFDFPEFLPGEVSRERWLAAGQHALDAQDFGVFRYLLDKIVRHLEAPEAK